MAKFRIGVVWTMMAFPEVEAESLQEATQKIMDGPLPANGEYLDESIGIDKESLEDQPSAEVAKINPTFFK